MAKKALLILDFGSQYTNLIRANLLESSIYSIIEPGDSQLDSVKRKYPAIKITGLILSGGSQSVYNSKIPFDSQWLKSGLPILGICYGHQLLVSELGGVVKKQFPEYGYEDLFVMNKNSELFKGVHEKTVVWMSHGDTALELPQGFEPLASTKASNFAAIWHPNLHVYGVQFHPEVSHTEEGKAILENFAIRICGMKQNHVWNSATFTKHSIAEYRNRVQDGKIIIGLSGGVDSLTMGALLRTALPRDQLIGVYVDTGLMPEQTEYEVRTFCKALDIPYIKHICSDRVFRELKGVVNPTSKGKIIGNIFAREFETLAKEKGAQFFAQGTIWSDVVESGVTKFSSQIKPHHNVAGFPDNFAFILLEPLRELFKNEVRDLARYLELPSKVVKKKVFPGPGFSIRIQGEVTREKVDIVRKCTGIIEEVIFGSEIADEIWMAFAILINVPSLGVMGDQRVENEEAVVVRIIESKNSMTANFSQLAFPFLAEISNRIVKETNIGRVVYDITNKPPATIEWQ